MQIHELPGLAVGIVSNNQIVYANGFGLESIASNIPVSLSTVFHTASLSKPFVATALMQLYEKGIINIKKPVIKYIPYFKLANDKYASITIQQMLSHVSGMPDVVDYEWDKPQYDDDALEKYVRSLYSYSLLAEPGQIFSYSNIAYECWGDIIAKASGATFENYIDANILQPANMKNSSFLMPKVMPGNWAYPHIRLSNDIIFNGYPYNRIHAPSSTLHSNIIDMCMWVIMTLQNGYINGNQIISSDLQAEMVKPWFTISGNEFSGLGWFIKNYKGNKLILHEGGDIGFESYIAILPEQNAAVIVLCNMVPSHIEKLTLSIIDIILGYEPQKLLYSAASQAMKMNKEGSDAAIYLWKKLYEEGSDKYDFNINCLENLDLAVASKNEIEAEKLVEFYAGILGIGDLVELEEKLSIPRYLSLGSVKTIIHEAIDKYNK